MTERFVTIGAGMDYGIRDMENGNFIFEQDITDLVNNLYEENQSLKNKLEFFNELNEPYGTLIEENQRLKQEKKVFFEILDAFINGVKDEKGIAPENEKFQYAMNEVLKYLIRLKQDLRNPNQYLKKRNDVELSTNNRCLKEEIK